MVGTLNTPETRRRLRAPLVTAVAAAGLFITANCAAAETSITLNQGANIAVTAPDDFNQMAFDLAGQIWLRGEGLEPAQPLTEAGVLNQRPSFSRDGRLVAYVSLLSDNLQILVTDLRSGVTRQVTFGPFDHTAPAWSPAGDRIVMSSNRGGNFDIWEVELDNLDLNQLTFSASNERDPAWNDEGTILAYVAESASGSSLYILSPGNKPRRVLHENERIAAPAWRPGGGLLTYTRIGAQGNQLRMLILSSPAISKPITQHEQVSPRPAHWLDRMDFLYAADGKIRRRELGLPGFDDIPFSVRIDISRDTRSIRDASFTNFDNRATRGSAGQTERADGRHVVAALSDLWEFQRENNGNFRLIRQLTNDAFIDAQPAYSPDGQRLAFVSDRSGLLQIWVLELESLDMRPLTREEGIIGDVAWSPDGSAVVYQTIDNNGGFRLRLASINGSLRQTLSASAHKRGKPVFADGAWSIEAGPDTQTGAMGNDGRRPLPLSWRPAGASERYIVRAGRIFDGIGPEYVKRQDIVIEHNLIVAIRPWSEVEPDIPVIDASALTVIPGLIDLASRPEPADVERDGRKWLAAGVTTIRQTVDLFNQAEFDRTIERLESWSSGRRMGPRLMLAVRPCRDHTGRIDEPLFEQVLANAAPLHIVAIELCPDIAGEELAETVRRAHESGLSVIATSPSPGMTPGVDELRPDVLMITGRSEPDPAAWRDFLLVSGSSGANIPSRLVTPFRAGSALLDGLNTSWQYRKIFTAAEQDYFNAYWHSNRPPQELAAIADPNRILGSGGGIVLGSEAPSSPQGLGLHGEMRRLVAGSVQPFQVLKIASLDAARSLGYGESLGLVRVGHQADLVILDGDPLTDIDAAANVAGTIVRGRYYSRADLTTAGLRTQSVGKFYNSARR